MGDIQLATQSGPVTPGSGNAILFIDTTVEKLFIKDDAGLYHGRTSRSAVASQGPGFAADTYVTNSGVQVPSFGMQAEMQFVWSLSLSKTAAGVATPVFNIRLGAAQTTADTARLTITGPAQTAAIDVALLAIMVTVRSVSAAGVIQGLVNWSHNGAAAGFANNNSGSVEGTSAAFDNSAVGGLFLGLSINGGAAAAWTLTQVQGTLTL
jgi:hypothetical protein